MPTFSNVHAELENNELHLPRDFSLAENDTTLSKNLLGNLQWQDTFWQRPVLGFADATFPPLTLQHGDRYILLGNASLGSTAIDTSIDTSMDTSMDSTAAVLPIIDETPVHPTWGEVSVGDVVEFYRNDNKDLPVFEWRSVAPKSGCQVFNLADKSTYYFSGSAWVKHTHSSQPVSAQLSVTYAALSTMANAAGLTPGLRYWVTDRDILLTATTLSALSIEGDYTMSLKAQGNVDLLSGTSGSIDSIEVGGINLLSSAVIFDTDLMETANSLADEVNNNNSIHGFTAISIGTSVYIVDVAERGATLNGLEVTVNATGITTSSSTIAKGVDKGERWFRAKYRFEDDYLFEVADSQGNVVSCEPSVQDIIGINPIAVFPWGYASVTYNTVRDSLFLCFPHDAKVQQNDLKSFGIVFCKLLSDDSFTGNCIREQSLLKIASAGNCSLVDNDISGTHMEMLQASGNVTNNRLIDSECDLSKSTLEMTANSMTHAYLIATEASVVFIDNEVVDSTIDVGGVLAEYVFRQNQVKNSSNISLQRAHGEFVESMVEHSEVTGNDSNTAFQNNKVSNFSTITLTNYVGSQYYANEVSSSTINLLDSSGDFMRNQVHNSIVQMQRHTGDCTQNIFMVANITSNDSGSQIDNNYIDQSDVLLSNTNGDFSSNKATFYSTYNLDGYLGARVLLCELMGSSILIGTGNTQEQGRITLEDLTTLDISDEGSSIYLSKYRVPSTNLVMKDSQINTVCTQQNSSVHHEIELNPDGSLDTDSDQYRYGGVFDILNSGTLTSIIGTATLPKEFILRASGSVNVSIDTTAAGISIVNGVTVGTLLGANSNYVKVSQQNGHLFITEAYTS